MGIVFDGKPCTIPHIPTSVNAKHNTQYSMFVYGKSVNSKITDVRIEQKKKEKEVSKKTQMNTLWGRKSAQTDKIHRDGQH